MHKISIIIPIFDVENYLKRTLNSVISQTYSNLEILCINDGSTDDSLNILQWYAALDSRIKIINQSNQGVSSARNTGLNNATGDFIMFLDSDDLFEPDAVEKAYNCIVSNNADIIVFNTNYINESDKITTSCHDINFLKQYQGKRITMDIICDNTFITDAIWNKIYRQEFLSEHGIRFIQGQNFGEDNIFCIFCIINNAKIYTLPNTLYKYRITRNTSISHNLHNKCSALLNSIKYFVECEQFKNTSDKFKIKIIDKYLERILSEYNNLSTKYLKFNAIIKIVGLIRYLKHHLGIELLNQCPHYNETIKINTYKFFVTKKLNKIIKTRKI